MGSNRNKEEHIIDAVVFDSKEDSNSENLLNEEKSKKGTSEEMTKIEKKEYLIYDNMNSEELFIEFQKAKKEEDSDKAQYILELMSSSVTNITNKKTIEELINKTPQKDLSMEIIAKTAAIDTKKAEKITMNMILTEKIPYEKALPVLSNEATIQVFKAIIEKIHEQDLKFEDLQNQLNDVNQNIATAKTSEEVEKYSNLNKELQTELEKLAKDKKELLEDKIKKENELKKLQSENSINIDEMKKLQELIKEFEEEQKNKKDETTKLSENLNKKGEELKKVSIEKENIKTELNDIINIIAEKTDKEAEDININNLPIILKEFEETYKTDKSDKYEETEEELRLLKESSSETIKNLEKTIEDLQKQINKKKSSSTEDEDSQEEEEVYRKPKGSLAKKTILFLLGLILVSLTALGFLIYKGDVAIDNLLNIPSAEETKIETLEDLPLEKVNKEKTIKEEERGFFSEPDKSYLGNEKENDLEHDINIAFDDLPENNNSEMILEPNDIDFNESQKVNTVPEKKNKINKNTKLDKMISKKETSKSYLESMKSAFKVNNNKQLIYMDKVFNKGEVFKNFKIAYITKSFVMFMDLDNNNKIIKVYL